MKRRWFLIALCSLIFGAIGTVVSSWGAALWHDLRVAPPTTGNLMLSDHPGTTTWTMIDELSPGVTRTRALWVASEPDSIGRSIPDDAPGWVLHQPDTASTTTMGYGWPMVAMRWGAKGAFGGGVSSMTLNISRAYEPKAQVVQGASGQSAEVPSGISADPTVGMPSGTPAAQTQSALFVAMVPGARPARVVFIQAPLSLTLSSTLIELPVHPYWPGFLVNTLVYGAIALLIIVLVARIRHRRRQHAGQCLTCGYDRHGLSPDAPCPECGQLAASPVDPVPSVASAVAESPPPTS